MEQTKLYLSTHWFFFLLTFVFSWFFWSIAILLNQVFTYFPTIIFYALGGFGPSIIGIILTYLSKDKDEIRDFWNRSRDYKNINYHWYGSIIIISLTPHLIAGGLSLLLGGNGIRFDQDFISNLFFSIIFLIIGVLAEEFGWRGFVLDPLQKKYNALASSLILGFFWGLWHLPLFVINATYQQTLGLFSLDFWMFFIVILPSSVFYTWLFNNTSRSILSAILLHFCINFFGELFSMGVQVRIISNIIVFIFAILVVLIYGYRHLIRT